MDDEPEGYREPARRRRDDDLDSEQAVEDAPAIQLANLLLIGACTPEGTLLRAGTWPDATVERREVGGAWTLALDPLVGGAATIARRFRLMTGLPVSKEPLIGFIHLRIGEREEDFCAFVRPVPRGERIVLRHLPLAVRRLVLGLPKDDGALAPLRWTIEHAFRLARSERPSDAIAPLTQLLGDLEPYGEDGARMKTRVAWALGSVAEEVGRLELAAQAFADGAAAALDSHGRGPTWVEAVERHAAVLVEAGRPREAVAALGEALATVREVCADDPLHALVLWALGRALLAAGDPTAAAASRDEAVRVLTELSGPDDPWLEWIRDLERQSV